MSENLPRHRGRKPERGHAHAPRKEFNAFLDHLNRRQVLRAEQIQTEIVKLYNEWASVFELLKEQFGGVWELFGEIESEVSGWYRGAPNGGPWQYIGLSREGYNFAVSIDKNFRRNAPYASKWLSITFGCGSAGRAGIGDERLAGRKGKMTDTLVGLEQCSAKDVHEQLKGVRQLNDKLKNCYLMFSLHHDRVGQKHAKVDFSVLNQHKLSALAQKLFIALNNDELEQLVAALPTAGASLLVDYKDGSVAG